MRSLNIIHRERFITKKNSQCKIGENWAVRWGTFERPKWPFGLLPFSINFFCYFLISTFDRNSRQGHLFRKIMGCCCCWSFMYKKSIYLSSGLQSTFVELFSKRSHWLLRSLQHLTYKLGRLTLQSHYIRFIEWRSFWSNRFALWQVTHTKSFIPNRWINNQSKFIYLSLSNERTNNMVWKV